jgi:AcrR family transcriptional regulator
VAVADLPEATIRALAMAPGPQARTPRERLLAQALELFYSQGIRAVGVDLLIERSGVAKATFYRHFPSKNDLIAAYLDRRQQAFMTWLSAAVDTASSDDSPPLLAMFDALGRLFADPEFRGCPIINAVAEMGAESDRLMDHARSHKLQLLRYIEELAVKTGVPEPADLSTKIALLVDGAFTGAQRDNGRQVAMLARQIAAPLLESALNEKSSLNEMVNVPD